LKTDYQIYHSEEEKQKIIRQTVDLAMLSQGLLKGEALSGFIRRSVELI
jgi:molecular chaperone HtpG